VRFGDGRAHYEHNYKHPHHDHMICSECGKIIEFYSPDAGSESGCDGREASI
jgi:Fur family ferric uptake transcriptional regulator